MLTDGDADHHRDAAPLDPERAHHDADHNDRAAGHDDNVVSVPPDEADDDDSDSDAGPPLDLANPREVYEHVKAEMADAFQDNVVLVYPDTQPLNEPEPAPPTTVEPGSAHGSGHGTPGAETSLSRRGSAVGARRKRPKHTSVRKAAFHIFKGNVGVGVFLLPMIYNDCGFVGSPLFGAVVGMLVIDTTMMLVSVKRKIDSPTVTSYSDVVAFLFGPYMRQAVNTMVVLTQLGFCLMYIQTAAGIFAELMPFNGAYLVFVVLESILMVPFSLLTSNLSMLAIASMVATFLVFFAVVATFFNSIGEVEQHGVAKTITSFGDVSKWSLYFASQMTVLEGICVVLPVENTIKREKRGAFITMLRRTLTAIVTLYVVYGSAGYWAYGTSVTSSTVSVMEKNAFAAFTRLALAVNVLLTHPLQFCPAIQILDRALGVDPHKVLQSPLGLGLRGGVNFVIGVFAAMVGPDALSLVLAFIGSIAAVFLAVILPATMRIWIPHALRRHRDAARLEAMEDLVQLRNAAAVADDDGGEAPTGEALSPEAPPVVKPPAPQAAPEAGGDYGSEAPEYDPVWSRDDLEFKAKLQLTVRRGVRFLLAHLREDRENDPVLRLGRRPPRHRGFVPLKVRASIYCVFGLYVLVVGTSTAVYDAIDFANGKKTGGGEL